MSIKWIALTLWPLLLVSCVKTVSSQKIRFFAQSTPKDLHIENIQTFGEWMVAYNISSRLIDGALEKSLKPGIASKWLISEDGKSVTFEIGDKYKFSDGSPVTVDDVEATFKFLIIRNGTTKLKLRDVITGCKKLQNLKQECSGLRKSGNSLTITLNKPYAPIIATFAVADFGILPKRVLESPRLNEFRVTSGPYSIGEFTDRKIELVPNAYYQSDGPIFPVEIIENTNIAQSESEVEKILQDKYAVVRVTENVVEALPKGSRYQIMWSEPNSSLHLLFGKNGPWKEDSKARLSLFRAIYKAARIKEIRNLSPNMFTRSYFGSADPAVLENLLIQEDDGQNLKQLLTKKTGPFKVLDFVGYKNDDLREVIAGVCRDLGLEVRFERVDNVSDLVTAIQKGDYDLTFHSLTSGSLDSDIFYQFLFSERNHLKSSARKLFEAQRVEMDRSKRKKLLENLNYEVINEGIILPLKSFASAFIYNSDLEIKNEKIVLNGEVYFPSFRIN